MIRAGDTLAARVLIVDDEPVNVRLLERMLLSAGYTALRCTTDSRQVARLVEEFQPDLIMLDLQMPHVDGFAVMDALDALRRPGEYPVLVLTADATPQTRNRALAGGAKDFLTKPFDRVEVLARTRNLLETQFLNRALRDANTALEERMVYQGLHDPLAGLANRALFHERVADALTRLDHDNQIAVLFLDLDHFKAVNDSLGHAEGDRLLTAVARQLLHATRGCDTVARLGGDEFAVLLEGFAPDRDALAIIQRIADALRGPVALHDRATSVAVSIGLAHAEPGQVVDDLLRNADLAMYHAKEQGRGGYQVFEAGMHTTMMERLELEADLRVALARDEFFLLYQPIVSLESGRMIGTEALLRWQHPTRGLMAPLTFIPIAEVTGLIVPIGLWALGEACRQCRRWQLEVPEGQGLALSVNISRRQLLAPSLVADVAIVLAETGLAPGLLTLEITESVLMQDIESTLLAMHALKALGIRLAIDDFGTGYSSLSCLQWFPVDTIKIDKAFIYGIARGGSDAALVRTIMTLADLLFMNTVAEGVEATEQRAQLIALGCVTAQGFLFAKPLMADEIRELYLGTAAVPAAMAA